MSLLDDIIEDRDCEGFDAYMRRSCRVVELEQGYIDLRRAADELAEAIDSDRPRVIAAALTAYRTATGDV